MPQRHDRHEELTVIPGVVPAPNAWPSGCRFHPRCAVAVDACRQSRPATGTDPRRIVRCLLVHGSTDEAPAALEEERR
jgi:oligopeptide/dipeptide ABC transporter ATP-binding protein